MKLYTIFYFTKKLSVPKKIWPNLNLFYLIKTKQKVHIHMGPEIFPFQDNTVLKTYNLIFFFAIKDP